MLGKVQLSSPYTIKNKVSFGKIKPEQLERLINDAGNRHTEGDPIGEHVVVLGDRRGVNDVVAYVPERGSAVSVNKDGGGYFINGYVRNINSLTPFVDYCTSPKNTDEEGYLPYTPIGTIRVHREGHPLGLSLKTPEGRELHRYELFDKNAAKNGVVNPLTAEEIKDYGIIEDIQW